MANQWRKNLKNNFPDPYNPSNLLEFIVSNDWRKVTKSDLLSHAGIENTKSTRICELSDRQFIIDGNILYEYHDENHYSHNQWELTSVLNLRKEFTDEQDSNERKRITKLFEQNGY